MTPAIPLRKIKALEAGLRASGVCALHLFGSQARGDAGEVSDVDLLFEIADGARFSLFDQARIARQLSEALGTKVDLVPRRALHPIVKADAEREMVTIFN